MFDSSRSYDNDIFAIIVSSMEVYNHFPVDLSDVVYISQNRLAHHMLTIDVEVHVFHQSFLGILINRLQFLPYCVLLHF